MIKIAPVSSILLLLVVNSVNPETLPNERHTYNSVHGILIFQEKKEATEFITGRNNVNVSGNGHELVIEFELNRFEGRSHRPFVAVWIENEKAETVKTIALWFNDYRWLPDLKRWYSKHYEKILRRTDIDAISGATRPAGKYTIKWDGKDYKGNLLKDGKYTVFIEVVRERGTYQLLRQEFEMNGQNQRYALASGTEVSSTIIEYRKTETTDPIP